MFDAYYPPEPVVPGTFFLAINHIELVSQNSHFGRSFVVGNTLPEMEKVLLTQIFLNRCLSFPKQGFL